MIHIRQTKRADGLYWVDIQLADGSWHYLHLPHTASRVRAFRRFMAQEEAR